MPEKSYEILLTKGDEQDLETIYDYIAEFDSEINANKELPLNTLKISLFSNHPIFRRSFPASALTQSPCRDQPPCTYRK